MDAATAAVGEVGAVDATNVDADADGFLLKLDDEGRLVAAAGRRIVAQCANVLAKKGRSVGAGDATGKGGHSVTVQHSTDSTDVFSCVSQQLTVQPVQPVRRTCAGNWPPHASCLPEAVYK